MGTAWLTAGNQHLGGNKMKKKRMSWGTAVKEYVTRTFDFKGRSSRAAYWWVILTISIITFPIMFWGGGLSTMAGGLNSARFNQIRIAGLIPGLIFLIPSFSLAVRRYRDAGLRPIYAYVIHGGSLLASLAINAMPFEMAQRYIALSFIVMVLGLIEFVIVLRPSYDADKMTMDAGAVGPGRAFKLFWKQYVQFKGRSSRSAYWWVVMWQVVIELGLYLLSFGTAAVLLHNNPTSTRVLLGLLFTGMLIWLFNLAMLIPSLSLAARRYRDAGVSPWWLIATRGGMLIFVVMMSTTTTQMGVYISAGIVVVLFLIDLIIVLWPSHQQHSVAAA